MTESVIEDHIAHLKGSNKSEQTVRTYSSHLNSFEQWVDDTIDGEVIDVGPRDLRRYFGEINDRLAEKTVRTCWYAIDGFYQDLVALEDIEENPMEPLNKKDYGGQEPEQRKGRPSGEEHTYLDRDEFERLVEQVPSPKTRSELITRLMFETGVRVGELSRIEVDNIDRDESQTEIRVKTLKQRKREDWRTVYLWTEATERLLSLWLDAGGRAGYAQAAASPYLFPSTKRKRIRPQDVTLMVKAAAEDAGLQEKIGKDANGNDQYLIKSHTLRHSACRFMLSDLQLELSTVQQIMGHSSVDITEQYSEPREDEIRQQARRARARLD